MCFDWALNDFLTVYALVFNALTNLLNAINSLLRLCNKQLCLNTKKHISDKNNWFDIFKSWDCLEIEFDQRVCDRIFIFYWFQICSVTSVILCTIEINFLCVAEKCCVFLRGSRSTVLVLLCWPREVCVLRGSRSLLWLCCKWSRVDCLVDFLNGLWEDWM